MLVSLSMMRWSTSARRHACCEAGLVTSVPWSPPCNLRSFVLHAFVQHNRANRKATMEDRQHHASTARGERMSGSDGVAARVAV